MPRTCKFVTVVALLLVLSVESTQNLRKTTCPICNMDAKSSINAPVLGGQHVYACEMAGHIDSLQNDPSANLGQPVLADITLDDIYKDAMDISCPVCGKGYSQLTHAVPWTPKRAQKIFTCSEEHAQLVFDQPTSYVAAKRSSSDFCYPSADSNPTAVMFNGFQLAIGGYSTCLILLFQPWLLSSAVKYAFAFLGVVLLAMSLEGFGELRDHIQTLLLQRYGVVVTNSDYVSLSTPQVSSVGTRLSLESSVLKSGPSVTVRVQSWYQPSTSTAVQKPSSNAVHAALVSGVLGHAGRHDVRDAHVRGRRRRRWSRLRDLQRHRRESPQWQRRPLLLHLTTSKQQ